jgi:hypothetical protein
MTAQQVAVRLALGSYVTHRNESRGVETAVMAPREGRGGQQDYSWELQTSQSWYHRPEHATLEYVRHAAGFR